MKLIAEGAEAKLFRIDLKTLKKIREKKPYRLKQIDDKIRKSRNKREFKILNFLFESSRLSELPNRTKQSDNNKINVPQPFEIESKKEFSFTFEFIDGKILKEILTKKLLEKAFWQIIKIHNFDIVHGDLTTLNMIVYNEKIYLIDFGLSEFSKKQEDKAVDLHLFFNCIKNEHPTFYKLKEKLLKEYSKKVERGEEIIKRLEKIERRGRNK